MATLAAIPALVRPAHRPPADTLRLFAKETKYEFLKLWRTKSFSLAVIGFPVMFYVLFGVSNRGVHQGAIDLAKYTLAGYACFGMISAALFGIGVGLATERSAGWLELKRASPMPPLAYLVAKCITAQAFGAIVIAVLAATGILFAGVHLTLREAVLLLAMPLAGSVPFAAMGLLFALVVPANAAVGVVNLVNLPMSFLSGLFIPLMFLPHWVRSVTPSLPSYHLSQLVLRIFGYNDASAMWTHWVGLAAFTMLMLGGSWAVFHRAGQDA